MNDLYFAAKYISLENVRKFISDYDRTKNEDTPLHYGAEKGQVDIVNILISSGADVNVKNRRRETPMHLSDNVEVFKALIAAGADVNAKNKRGETPLHLSDNVEVAKILIAAGADVNAKDKNKSTPLHHSNNAEVVKALIAAGADVNAKEEFERTPLHFSDNLEIAEALIAAGADVNVEDMGGAVPLSYCVEEGHVDIIKLLIAAGADITKNGNGRTLLEIALECQGEEMCKFIMKYAMLKNPTLNIPNFENELEVLNKLWFFCKVQEERLKETFLGSSGISFFKFITETDENKLALYSSKKSFGLNNEFKRFIYTQNNLLYAEEIEAQFVKGNERANLLHKSQELMKGYFYKILPVEIIREICQYLKNDDLKYFLSFHKSD